MDLRVSSRGKLYFLQAREVVFKGVDARPMGERGDPDLLLPAALRPLMTRLQAILQAHGLWRLPNARKQQPAPGCLTRLGDEPATLFEVLFAEIE